MNTLNGWFGFLQVYFNTITLVLSLVYSHNGNLLALPFVHFHNQPRLYHVYLLYTSSKKLFKKELQSVFNTLA